MIRAPAVAGAFYPDDPKELKKMIEGFLAQAKPPEINGRLRALIVPHAGYIYSGPIAAFGYKIIRNFPPGKTSLNDEANLKFVLLGPAHTVNFAGAALSTSEEWETPLGNVPLWQPPKIEPPFFDFDIAHLQEHCLEVQLPFIQLSFPRKPCLPAGRRESSQLSIFPVLLGKTNPEKVANGLEQWIDDETLIIVSSDLSHYHLYKQAKELDQLTIESILKNQITVLETQGEACGMLPILALLYLARKKGWAGQLLDYRNSGDTAGDKSRVVGYAAIAFSD